jgi:hypothetical protein
MDVNPYESPRSIPPTAPARERNPDEAPFTFLVMGVIVVIWLSAIAYNVMQGLNATP